MVKKTVEVSLGQGLHMRPAGQFARAMEGFSCDVWLCRRGTRANGKSVLNLICASIPDGAQVEICCEGADEKAALAKAEELLQGEKCRQEVS